MERHHGDSVWAVRLLARRRPLGFAALAAAFRIASVFGVRPRPVGVRSLRP
jgi:hypothetical protein